MPGIWAGGHSSCGDITKISMQAKSTKGGKWSSSQPCMPGGFSLVWFGSMAPWRGTLTEHSVQGGCWTEHGRLSCAAGDPHPGFCHMDSGLPRHHEQTSRCSEPHIHWSSKDKPSSAVLPGILKNPISHQLLCSSPWSYSLFHPVLEMTPVIQGGGLPLLARGYLLCLPASGLGSSKAEGCPPPPCPASFLVTPSSAPRGLPSPLAAEPAEGTSDCQPASPTCLGSLSGPAALLLCLCARWGALCSPPRVCLPCLVPNNNKVGLGWPHAHTSRQVALFLGSACCSRSCCCHGCLVWAAASSCPVRPVCDTLKENAAGQHSGKWPCCLSTSGLISKEKLVSHIYVLGIGLFRLF